jgi:hypothetical protein
MAKGMPKTLERVGFHIVNLNCIKMRKSFYSLTACLSLLLLSNMASAKHIFVMKFNGGSGGYNTTRETHNGDWHTLSCTDPGSESCTWNIQPLVITSGGTYNTNDIVSQAEAAIANQNYSGSYILGNQEYQVSWQGSDIYNFSVTIEDI